MSQICTEKVIHGEKMLTSTSSVWAVWQFQLKKNVNTLQIHGNTECSERMVHDSHINLATLETAVIA